MSRVKNIFRLFPILMIVAECTSENCPPKEYLPNCDCKTDDYYSNRIILKCKDIFDPDVFRTQIQSLNTSLSARIHLENFNLPHFLPGTFNGTNIYSLAISDGKLKTLSQATRPYVFSGLQNSLKNLYIFNVSEIKFWDWNHLRALRSLSDIILEKCSIQISSRPPALGKLLLQSVRIISSNFSNVGYRTFSKHRNLTFLGLIDNGISYIRRKSLPRPANRLQYLDLSNNSLVSLPDDIFEEMPALRVLDLSHNQFLMLHEHLFYPVFHQLQVFYISGNPLFCEVTSTWLSKAALQKDSPKYNDIDRVTCQAPYKLQGRRLVELYDSDFEVDNDLN